ncbi:hypothetical protein HMPREF9120_00366 [Neisseria sp. oral taxon 020 str. F0370]|uniref:hypothetical protein n=1 Tax=unclassified Neisseria TaxID=2623750 RepID=UPI0002A1C3EC|nr:MULTISPECIES: hypothetical protein [unclassified Neisseria]EKY09661.1 hypothetical protein HMPREF9120_00366 [Neisseria sp. oral taxon 020 str. F0370]
MLDFQPKLPKGRLKLLFQTASLFSGCLAAGIQLKYHRQLHNPKQPETVPTFRLPQTEFLWTT